jgi:hypothetical protein
MCDRVFVEWADGTWLSSGHNPDFQADLAEHVAQSGPPSSVEFRAAGTGYAAPTPCEDCGLRYAECKCDDEPCQDDDFCNCGCNAIR